MLRNFDDHEGDEIQGERHSDATAPGAGSRRSFLRKSALATAAPAALLVGGPAAEAASRNSRNKNNNISAFPAIGAPNFLRDHFLNVVNNENAHLSALLAELGPNARPKPTFQNITPANVRQFAQMGSMFCATGAGAYLGAAPYIANPYLVTQAGSIGQVELTQAGFLNSILGQTLLPGGSPFSVPLTLQEVVARATPFIASLNGGPPPSFSTTDRSLENDIAIFNVALILEYLEHDFYNTYFPIFYPA